MSVCAEASQTTVFASRIAAPSSGNVGRTFLSAWRARVFHAVSFHAVLTLLLLALVFSLGRKGISDPDIWWHLHNAEYLVQHHSLPNADMYSFTVSGHQWMDHEWLAELPYYYAWRTFGLRGVTGVMFIALSLIFLGVVYLCYRETGHYKASILATGFAVLLSSVSFGPRTILFGYLFLVILVIILQEFRRDSSAAVWLIPGLFCVWVNTHGSWLLGLIIFSIVIATGFLKVDWGALHSEKWTGSQRTKLILGWAASVALLFVNPFGSRLVFYPLDLGFRQKLNIEHVAEWVSVNFHDARGKLVIAVLLILIVSSLLRPRRWALAEFAVVLFAVYSGLTYIRFLFLAGIVLAPILAKAFDFVPRYRREMDTPIINAVVIVLIIAGIVHFWPRESELKGWVAEQYPADAISYIHGHLPTGPMLNFYLWGGYVNWRESDVKVFLDSRVDIFEYAGVLKDYLDLLALKNPQVLLDKYGVKYVLFPPNEPLTYALQHDPDWQVLYKDRMSVLFQKKIGAERLTGGRFVESVSTSGQ
jgi:hypothetical protein